MKQFILIYSTLVHNEISSNGVLFPSFDEALEYARKQASYHRHLASIYEEKIGDNHRHATIRLKGKDLNVTLRISDLALDRERKVLDTHLNTYSSWDYVGGIAI